MIKKNDFFFIMNYFTLLLNTLKVSKFLKSLLTNMSTNQIEFIPRDVAEFFTNENKDKITLSEKMIFNPTNGTTMFHYEIYLNDIDITNEDKYSIGKNLKGLYYLKDKKSGKRIEACDSSNDDLTIDSFRNQDDLLNMKYTVDTSSVSIAETSIESFSKTDAESVAKTIDTYSKVVKNNLPKTKVEEDTTNFKQNDLLLNKNNIHIDNLCKIFINHINDNLEKYKYYLNKYKYNNIYCLTGMEDIKNQLKLEYENNNNFWVENIKKPRFITSINDQLEKEKLKISVGQSLNNEKWTIVILHHIDNTNPSFKNINKNLNKK